LDGSQQNMAAMLGRNDQWERPMSKLVIADLEDSVELDREAMRVIVGLGTRPLWPRQSTAFFLMHQSQNATGLRAAAGRWSAFLRPLPIESLQRREDHRWKSQHACPLGSLDERKRTDHS
jgi:hypothetical protein